MRLRPVLNNKQRSERKQIGDSKSRRERIEIIETALAFILGQVAFDFAAFASGFSGGRADDVFVLILPQCQWFFGRTTY